MDNKIAIRNSQRDQAMKVWLKTEVEKGAKLPVMPDEVYEALDKIDITSVIEKLGLDIPKVIKFVNENNVGAIVYNWFYDGGEADNIHIEEVSVYETCEFDEKSKNTDLIKLLNVEGLEVDPKFKNEIDNDSIDIFCLDPIMGALYGTILPKWNDKFDEYYDINDELDIDVDLDEITDAYQELFHLKLITVLREIYLEALNVNPLKVTTGKPFHIFIKRHERWPMQVLSLNI